MAASVNHGVAGYNAGCRCARCKVANSDYRKDLRRRKDEAMGEPANVFRLATGSGENSVTSGNGSQACMSGGLGSANNVVAAVRAEIDALGEAARPGLAAAAIALAEVLANPKALSTRPAAAGQLANLLEQLRKNAGNKESKLAKVRALTSVKTG